MARENHDEILNKGKITCDRNILLSIINLAAKEINGVASLSNNFKPVINRMFSNRDYEGVKLKFENNGALIIDVYVNVYYGFSVPDIAYRIQENIKNSIVTMVDMKATKVNVHIVNVLFSKDEG